MIYAQLNSDNICVGISVLSGKANDSKLIPIENYDESFLWKKYENGQWSIEQYIPGTVVLHKDEVAALLALVSQQEAAVRTVTQARLEQLEGKIDALAAKLDAVQTDTKTATEPLK